MGLAKPCVGSCDRWIAPILAACGGGGGEHLTGQGSVRVAVTDAPSCGYDHVWVTVEKVRFHRSRPRRRNGGRLERAACRRPKRVDLLELTNGVLEELGTTTLPAGTTCRSAWCWRATRATGLPAWPMRCSPRAARSALATPSAQQSGLKLQAHFEVPRARRPTCSTSTPANRWSGGDPAVHPQAGDSVVPRIARASRACIHKLELEHHHHRGAAGRGHDPVDHARRHRQIQHSVPLHRHLHAGGHVGGRATAVVTGCRRHRDHRGQRHRDGDRAAGVDHGGVTGTVT